MKYLIIGLGNFGTALSVQLLKAGHEVIGVDSDAVKVDLLKEQLAAGFVMDSTDPVSLQALPFKSVDATFVCIGEDFGSSVRTVAMLLSMGIPNVWARGNDEVHRSVLSAMGIRHILSPELQAASILSEQMELGQSIRIFHVSEDACVVRMELPAAFWGYRASDLNLWKEFRLKLLAILRGKSTMNALGVEVMEDATLNCMEQEVVLKEGDVLVIYGNYQDFRKFHSAF